MANVLYIVWWEGVRKSGVLNNQVYRLLEMIHAKSEHRVSLLSGGAFWRAHLLRRLQSVFPGWAALSGRGKTFENTDEIRERLNMRGVNVKFRQSAFCPESVYISGWLLFLLPWWNLWYLHSVTRQESIDVVHCRSYYPAWLAVLSRLFFRDRYQIIFDTRGLLPDEGVATGRFRVGGYSFRVWKWVEGVLMRRVDRVVNVSETFTSCLAREYPTASLQTIYASVDLSAFERALTKRTGTVAAGPLSEPGAHVLVYLGSISESGWHSIAYLAKLFYAFHRRFEGGVLLVVTGCSGHDVIRDGLVRCGVSPSCLRFRSASRIEEVADLLLQATYAALPFRMIRGECDLRVGMTMISSKMEEYFAAGVPVLCNQNVGGGKRLIEEHGVGYAVNLEDEHPDSACWVDPDENPAIRERCRGVAKRFGLPGITAQYADLYRELSPQ